MRTRIGIQCLACLVFFAMTAFLCAESKSLSLDEAIQLAIENNRDLESAKIRLNLAENGASNSWNAFLPTVSLSGSLQNTHSLPGSSGQVENPNNLSVSAGATLSLNAGVGETLRQDALARESAIVAYRKTEATLINTVKKKYSALLADGKTLEMQRKNLELAEKQEAAVKGKYDNGLASELEYLQAQYSASSLGPKITQKEREYVNSLGAFATLIGLPVGIEPVLSDSRTIDIVAVTMPENIDTLIEGRFDVAAAALSLESAKSKQRAASMTRYAPTVSFSESVGVGGLQDGIRAPETGTLNVAVSIPLSGYIPGSKQSVAAKEYDAAVRTAEITLEQTRTSARQEIDRLFGNLTDLVESVRINTLNEKIVVRTYALSLQGYDSGMVTQMDLDKARQNLLEAQQNILIAENSYRDALIDLTYALNVSEADLCAPRGNE